MCGGDTYCDSANTCYDCNYCLCTSNDGVDGTCGACSSRTCPTPPPTPPPPTSPLLTPPPTNPTSNNPTANPTANPPSAPPPTADDQCHCRQLSEHADNNIQTAYVGRDGDDLTLNSTSAGRILLNGVDLADIAGCGNTEPCQQRRRQARRVDGHVDADEIQMLRLRVQQSAAETKQLREEHVQMLAMIKALSQSVSQLQRGNIRQPDSE